MYIRLTDGTDAVDAVIGAVDDVGDLHVEATTAMVGRFARQDDGHWLTEHAGAQVSIDPTVLRDKARSGRGSTWDAAFDSMVDFAAAKGWVTAEGRLIAHVVEPEPVRRTQPGLAIHTVDADNDPLLQPIQVGPVTLRNRIVLTTHLAFYNAYHPQGDVTKYVAYVQRRAKAGVAMISLQSIKVLPVSDERPFAYEYLRERLSQLADAAHRHGARVVVQLQHFGYKQGGFGSPDMAPLWAFEPIRSPASYETAHRMTSGEVAEIVEGYAATAGFVVSCGVDGVELAGSHGYLLYQSINTKANHRDDEWGRPLYFWKAVIAAVRDRVGPSAILGARVCSDDLVPPEQGGVGRAVLRDAAVQIAETGLIDYLNPTEGADPIDYGRVVGSFRRPHGDFLSSVRDIRAAVAGRVPVIGCGRITTTDAARDALERGDCDLVGMTRAHIADPDVIPNLMTGQAHRTRPCVGANLCLDRTNRGQDIACFHNPDLLDGSAAADVVPAQESRRVLVVGGGPAGTKSAEIAARRGHRVTLVERAGQLGGRLALIDGRTHGHELRDSIDWLAAELDQLGVDVRLHTDADAQLLAGVRPDTIVLATGSTAVAPAFPTDGSIPVWALDDFPSALPEGASIVVYDLLTNEESDVTWEQLTALGHRVSLVTPHPVTGAQLGYTHRVDHTRRLAQQGCELHERTEIDNIIGGTLVVKSTFDGSPGKLHADGVVVVGLRSPELRLHGAALAASGDVRVVGDATAPRTAIQALREGHALGRSL